MTPAPVPARRGRRARLRARVAVVAVLVAVLVVVLGAASCGAGRTPAPETATPTTPRPSPSSPSNGSTLSLSTTTTSSTVPVTAAPVRVSIGFLGAPTATARPTDPGRPAGSDVPDLTIGAGIENGERLAVSQFTSDHPGLVVTIDEASGAGGVAAAARRLVAAGVVAVIGPELPTEARAALPALSAAGIPAVSAAATATDLTASGWTFFRVVADDRQQGIDAAAELVTSLHLTTLAVLAGDADGAATRTAWVSSTATQLGATVTDEPGLVTGTTAAGTARAVVGSGVGGIYFSGPAAVAQVLVSDLVADGYQGVMLVASDAASSVLSPLGSTADGVYLASVADAPAAIAAHGGNGLVFEDAYRAAFGSEPPVWAAEAYDATNVVLQAVAAGATTGPAVTSYLYNHTWTGVTGMLSFDSSGDQLDPPIFISRLENGVPVQIATAAQTSG